MKLKIVRDFPALYAYQQNVSFPYHFAVSFAPWKNALLADTDGEGRALFRDLVTLAAYEGDRILGFIQYGHSALGFDDRGEVSGEISYPVIRMLCFDPGQEAAGRALLETALNDLGDGQRVYAFFHYFGMSCYGRHGKLYEGLGHIRALLQGYGFVTEHENVYYAGEMGAEGGDISLRWGEMTRGNQQFCAFLLEGQSVGCCEIHHVRPGEIAYLRWIFVTESRQNQGLGSRCMAALKSALARQGVTRLDTDTAMDNLRAQHFYEKNGFVRMGITRSFYRDAPVTELVQECG